MKRIKFAALAMVIAIALFGYVTANRANACGSCSEHNKATVTKTVEVNKTDSKGSSAGTTYTKGACEPGSCVKGASDTGSGNCSSKSSKLSDKTSVQNANFANIYAVEDGNSYAVCPVSGKSFKVTDSSVHSDVDGSNYYWCCNGCEGQFKADKSGYSGKLEKNLTEAKAKFAAGEKPDVSKM